MVVLQTAIVDVMLSHIDCTCMLLCMHFSCAVKEQDEFSSQCVFPILGNCFSSDE